MSFIDTIGSIFDEEDEVTYTIRHKKGTYNHARVKNFEPGRTSYYETKLVESDLEHELVEAANGPEFEVWEDRKI